MFQIQCNVSTASDARLAAAVMAAVSSVLPGAPEPVEVTTQVVALPARRTRRLETKAAVDPAELYATLGGEMPSFDVVGSLTDTPPAQEAAVAEVVAEVAPEPAAPEEPAQAAPVATEEQLALELDELRNHARELGTLWLRPLLAKHGTDRISALSPAAIREALADAREKLNA